MVRRCRRNHESGGAAGETGRRGCSVRQRVRRRLASRRVSWWLGVALPGVRWRGQSGPEFLGPHQWSAWGDLLAVRKPCRALITEQRTEHSERTVLVCPRRILRLRAGVVPSETFRGPRGLRKGVVQDLERLYRLRPALLFCQQSEIFESAEHPNQSNPFGEGGRDVPGPERHPLGGHGDRGTSPMGQCRRELAMPFAGTPACVDALVFWILRFSFGKNSVGVPA